MTRASGALQGIVDGQGGQHWCLEGIRGIARGFWRAGGLRELDPDVASCDYVITGFATMIDFAPKNSL